MRADRLRPGDRLVLLGVEVESVFTEAGSTFVTYRDSTRTGEVFRDDRQVVIACEHVEEEDDDA